MAVRAVGSLGLKGIGLLALGADRNLDGDRHSIPSRKGSWALNCCSDEQIAVSTSGLNYNLPYPIGRAETVNVDQIRDVTIGSREFSNQRRFRQQA